MGRFSEPCPGCGPQGCALPTRAPCPVAWGRRCDDKDPNSSVNIRSVQRTPLLIPWTLAVPPRGRLVRVIQGKGFSSSDLGDR